MDKLKIANYLIEKGWEARENFEFEKSKLFLKEAKTIFEELGEWHGVIECLNHLALLHKVNSYKESLKAIEYAKSSLTFCSQKSQKDVLSQRACASVYKYAGQYEQAEKFLRGYIEKQKNPAARGEMRGDLALNYMRRGNLDEAKKQIRVAFGELEEGWDKERMPHKMIWRTKLLMYKSLIYYNSGEKDQAEELANEALNLSKKHNLKMRSFEAKELLDLFNKK